jgi:hypothetical protein
MPKRLIIAICASASTTFASAECLAPKICPQIQSAYESAKAAPKDLAKFKKLIELLVRASAKSCKIEGVDVLVPAYRACYDGGFTQKIDSKGNLVIDRYGSAPMNETAVESWSLFADKSKFPDGRAFTRGKLFQGTIDGDWGETFSDSAEN